MMYVDISSNHEVHLMGMTFEDARLLASMIRGAGILERRAFHRVLHQLEQPIDKLMK